MMGPVAGGSRFPGKRAFFYCDIIIQKGLLPV